MWDLGISDSMAIWFVQLVGQEIHLIDYYENSSYGLAHYVSVLNNKGYTYVQHCLPHDGGQRQLTATEKALTVENQLQNLGLNNIKVIKRTNDVYADIQNVRGLLSRCYFDKEKTKEGFDCLKQYRREFDEKRQVFKSTPLHDWTSHGADAFRILPQLINISCIKKQRAKRYNGNF